LKKTHWLKTVETNTTISLMEPTTVIVARTLNLTAVETTTVTEANLQILWMMTAATKNAADLQVGEEALQAVDLKLAVLQAVVAHAKLLSMTIEILTHPPLLKSISQL
jgi:hypothetical protein